MTRYFSVRNFDKFQHYRDRSPPWIKLYTSLLDDYEFFALKDNERWHLVGIWILASRLNNRVPYDPEWVGRKIGANTKLDLDLLLDQGWITFELQEDREAWASRYVSTAVRGKLLKAAKGRCTACGSKKNLEIDHKIAISQGGTSDESNLQVLCRCCNRKKRSSSNVSADVEPALDFSLASRDAPAHSREGETEGEGEDKQHCNVAASQHDIGHQEQENEHGLLPGLIGDGIAKAMGIPKKNGLTEEAHAILEFLNLLTHKNYRLKNPNGKLTANAEIIIARLKEGYESEVLTQVIAQQNAEWAGTEHAKYLRPATLFNKTKFSQYVGGISE